VTVIVIMPVVMATTASRLRLRCRFFLAAQ
jgi:hypothetical protein